MANIEIEEGLELDRAVAEAIGLVATHRVLGGTQFFVDPLFGTSAVAKEFSPSANLNDAFEAADRAGMFRGCSHILGRGSANEPDGAWWVHHTEDRDEELSEYSRIGSGATTALAICAAILALKRT